MNARLERTLAAAGLSAERPSDAGQWDAWLAAVDDALAAEQRERQAAETEVRRLNAAIDALRSSTHAHHEDLGSILGEVTATLGLYREAIQGDRAAQQHALDLARRRFSLTLHASWSDVGDGLPEDTAAVAAIHSTALREVQLGLRGLGKALVELVELASEVSATQQQLELAGSVQMMLVPKPQLELPQLRIASWFEPATHVGGDWWSAAPLSPDAALVVLGDVSGHGAPAAIIAGAAKGACDLARMGMRGGLMAHQLLRMLNRIIIEAAQGHYLMTGLAIKATGKELWIANAGHPAPYRVRGGKLAVLGALGEPPLGAESVFAYSEHHDTLEPGDLIVAFTDGVTETEGPDGKALGERALRALVEAKASLGAEGLVAAVREAVLSHRGSGAQADDISFIVAEVRG